MVNHPDMDSTHVPNVGGVKFVCGFAHACAISALALYVGGAWPGSYMGVVEYTTTC